MLAEKDNKKTKLVKKLSQSEFYQNYAEAYTETTELPLILETKEGQPVAEHNVGPLDSLILEEIDPTEKHPFLKKNSLLSDLAEAQKTEIPVKMGKTPLVVLKTGHIAPQISDDKALTEIKKQIADLGVDVNWKEILKNYFKTKKISHKKYRSCVHLLKNFAYQLKEKAEQLLIQESQTEPVTIEKARDYIHQNFIESLTLKQVAQAIHLSESHFSTEFKQTIGVSFTEYVNCLRIQKAKKLLVNLRWHISEIAFEVGFQSLSQFNRCFLKFEGQPPSKYRKNLELKQKKTN